MRMHLRYLRYILRHKWYVFVDCCRLGIPWLGIIHDLSKFLPDEWFPYARYFYGKYPHVWEIQPAEWRFVTRSQEDVETVFDVAWLEHIHRNRHHPQHWVLREDSGALKLLDMPERYLYEMVADWDGAGRALGNADSVAEWYAKNRDRLVLSDFNRTWIEHELALSRALA